MDAVIIEVDFRLMQSSPSMAGHEGAVSFAVNDHRPSPWLTRAEPIKAKPFTSSPRGPKITGVARQS